MIQVPLPLTSSSSSRCRTSAWIISLFRLGSALPHCWNWVDPSPCLPMHGFPMMSFSFSALTACAPDVSAAHLCPDLFVTPAFLTFSSLESCYVIATLQLATLNSSTTDDRGSCNWPDLMYSPTDVKLVGIPRHLRRCFFTHFSILSSTS